MTLSVEAGGADQLGSTRALRRCVPGDLSTFASQVWGRCPALSSGAETGEDFSDLLSIVAVDELVSRRGLRAPFIRMARGGRVVPVAEFTGPGGAGATVGDQVIDDKVLAQLADGATLVLQGLHRVWPPLVEFAAELAGSIGHPVQINAYLTPSDSQGFSAHYDTHDVFVLQISGHKRWLVHPPVVENPLPDQKWESHREEVRLRALEPPEHDVVLRSGDVLYLPRGYLHSATTSESPSLHLTVGIHALTETTLLTELLPALSSSAEFRRSLPFGVDLSDPETLAPLLARAVAGFAAKLATALPEQTAHVAGRLDQRLSRDMRPAPIAPLAQSLAVRSVSRHSPFTLRPVSRVRIDDQGDQVEVIRSNGRFCCPAGSGPALALILTGGQLTAADLPDLGPVEQLDLVRTLLREAVIVPAGDEHPARTADRADRTTLGDRADRGAG